MGQSLFKRFAFDIHNSVCIFVLPVKLAANGEHVLIVFVRIRVLGGFREFVIVDGTVPELIHSNKIDFRASRIAN